MTGRVPEDRNSLRLSRRRLLGLITAAALADAAGAASASSSLKAIQKRIGGRVPFVLVEAPGDVTPGHDVPAGELRAAIDEVSSG